MTETDTASPQRPVSRRALAAGVAWSAPAVWLTAAAPAMAASPDYKLVFTEALYSGANGKWEFSVSIQNFTAIEPTVAEVKITAPYGWTFTFDPNKTVKPGATITVQSSKMLWDGKTSDQSRGRWGAGPCTTGAIAGYCKTATCNASTDTCTCSPGCTCHGPCAIFAMQGPYSITVTFTYKVNTVTQTWTVTSPFPYPTRCGNSNDSCAGLLANYP